MLQNAIKDNWAYFLFFACPGFILVLDLTLLGSGLWSEPLGFSVRKLSFAVVCFYSTWYWLRRPLLQGYELVAVLFMVFFLVVWCWLVPSFKGGNIGSALSDGQLFFGLLFAPAIYSVIDEKGCWNKVISVIFKAIIFLAFLHIGIGAFDLIFPERTLQLVEAMRRVMEPLRSEEETSVFIGYVGDRLRVFWGSSIYLLAGFYLAVKKFSSSEPFKSVFILTVIIIAILLTLTRGVILSIPLFFVISTAFGFGMRVFSNRVFYYFIFAVSLSLVTVPIILLSDPSVLAMLGIGRDISDDIRSEQVYSLLRVFEENFFVGAGFGASASYERSESAPWSYEMSILALYMKVGLVGIFSIILVFFLFCLTGSSQDFKGAARPELARTAALMTVVVFCSNTNPYLFSMLGVGLFLFIYFEFRTLSFASSKEKFPCLGNTIVHP